MLGVVGSNLKMVKIFMQHLWMLHDVVVVWPGSCNNFVPGRAHWFDFQLAKCRNRVAKRGQRVAPNNGAIVFANSGPTMLGYVALSCCYRLAGA